uniref:Uncharacterized protein n=1 Tax=Arundo donax TaxID=35708 RepID=A0A0A9UCH9_ARUDO
MVPIEKGRAPPLLVVEAVRWDIAVVVDDRRGRRRRTASSTAIKEVWTPWMVEDAVVLTSVLRGQGQRKPLFFAQRSSCLCFLFLAD